jgi:hypothetical protein
VVLVNEVGGSVSIFDKLLAIEVDIASGISAASVPFGGDVISRIINVSERASSSAELSDPSTLPVLSYTILEVGRSKFAQVVAIAVVQVCESRSPEKIANSTTTIIVLAGL